MTWIIVKEGILKGDWRGIEMGDDMGTVGLLGKRQRIQVERGGFCDYYKVVLSMLFFFFFF